MRYILNLSEKILLELSTAMFLFIVIVTLVQVFFRYVLNDALSWSAELTRIVFIWMTFLCSAVAISRTRHMRVDTFINLFPDKIKLIAEILVHILLAGFMALLTYQSFEMVERTSRILTSALRWPRSVLFMPLVLGGGFMFVFCLRVIVDDCLALIDKREEETA